MRSRHRVVRRARELVAAVRDLRRAEPGATVVIESGPTQVPLAGAADQP